MDEHRRRAWAALELGPLWALRQGPAEAVVVAEAAVATGTRAATETAEVPETVAAAGTGETARAVPAPGPADVLGDDPLAGAVDARSRAIAGMAWGALGEAVAGCTACGLCQTRRRTVFGVGVQPAPWMFIGEAPGEQEDERGEPFVGPAGGLLDRMLASIDVARDRDAFIANVLKCRPPRNRDPLPEEVARCEPFLLRQIELVRPRVIVALGRFAAQSLLRTDDTIARLRGRAHRFRAGEREIPLVITYHPAYLLRNLPDKAKAWADLRLARRVFEGAERESEQDA